jgi:putative glycosyltransferase
MKLSIVATLFNSSGYVEEFVRRISASAGRCTSDYEIVLVSDGSPDDSVQRTLAINNPRIVIIELSRNFGHHPAILCGLAHTSGELVFLTDVDLEEPPEDLERFWVALTASTEVDVVEGRITDKPGGILRRLGSLAFYRFFNTLSVVKVSDRATVSRLMRRDYVNALLQYGESDPFLPALWVDAGFKRQSVPTTKTFDGRSNYTFRRRFRMAINAITSYSTTPLHYLFYVGSLFSVGALLFVIILVLQRTIYSREMFPGWSSIVAALFFIGGITIFAIGLLGAYIARIYREVKARPNTIVRRIHSKSGDLT